VSGLTNLILGQCDLTAQQVGVLVRPLHTEGSRLAKLELRTVVGG
jgi:hypothetical protein